MRPDFIFSDRWQHKVSRHTVFWLSFVIFCTIIYGGGPFFQAFSIGNYASTFVDALGFLPIHIMLSYFIMYFLLPRFVSKEKYLAALVLLILAILTTAVFSHILSQTVVLNIRLMMHAPPQRHSFMYGLMAGLRGGITIAGFATAIRLMKLWYVKKQEAEMADKLRMQTELTMLKAQVHPHFLFNTLNNIYAFSYQGDRTATDMILKLSEMLRYILYECQAPFVPLEKELQLLENFMELEKVRYGNSLDLRVNVKGDPKGRLIAPLILLPFVENSFKHGASRLLDQPWINLDIVILKDCLRMRLVNAKLEKELPVSKGIGLQNVRQRLQLLYDDRANLEIVDAGDSFLVKLEIPFQAMPVQTGIQQVRTIQHPFAGDLATIEN